MRMKTRQKWFDDRLQFAHKVSSGMKDKIKYLTITEPGKVILSHFQENYFHSVGYGFLWYIANCVQLRCQLEWFQPRSGCQTPFSGTRGLDECTMFSSQIFTSASMLTVLCFSGRDQFLQCSNSITVNDVNMGVGQNVDHQSTKFDFTFPASASPWPYPARWTSSCTHWTARCVPCRLQAVSGFDINRLYVECLNLPSLRKLDALVRLLLNLRWMGHGWPCLPLEEARPCPGWPVTENRK